MVMRRRPALHPVLTAEQLATDPLSPAELAFLELQRRPRDYALWCELTRKRWTEERKRASVPGSESNQPKRR